jgi:hypothetical protein
MPESVLSTETLGGGAESLKVPPHSIPAEQSVLGGLMLDNEAWDQIADRVSEDDFYRRDHRLIFRAIGELADASQPFDVVTLAERLERNRLLNDAGGLAYRRQHLRHHRPADRLHRVRRDDRRPAAVGPADPRRPSVDGQDHPRAEHGRVRGDQGQEGGAVFSMEMPASSWRCGCCRRSGRIEAQACAPASSRRGLAALTSAIRHAARGQDLHRRHPGAVADDVCARGAAAQARARPGPDRDRLPAADAAVPGNRRTARPRFPRSRARSRRWPRNCTCR